MTRNLLLWSSPWEIGKTYTGRFTIEHHESLLPELRIIGGQLNGASPPWAS
jgi:hypothetical protein